MINYINGQIVHGEPPKAKVILPCPFCGATPKIDKTPVHGYTGWFEVSISCPNCHGVTFATFITDTRTEDEAYDDIFARWNRRIVTHGLL